MPEQSTQQGTNNTEESTADATGTKTLTGSERNTANEQHTTEKSNHKTAKGMEVHHHPDIHHKPKPWKEYIVEYVMIVLAVTTGFFAETLREHMGEREREHEIIRSLANDLDNDTASISYTIASSDNLSFALDTFAQMLSHYVPGDSVNKKLYQLYIKSTLQDEYTPILRTLKQLRNNGEWRLIKNKDVTTELLDYEAAADGLDSYNKIYENYTDRSVFLATEVFDMQYLKYYTGTDGFTQPLTYDTDTSMVIAPEYRKTHLALRSTKPELLGRYANYVWNQMVVERSYRQQLMDFKGEETRLLELLKKHYPGVIAGE